MKAILRKIKYKKILEQKGDKTPYEQFFQVDEKDRKFVKIFYGEDVIMQGIEWVKSVAKPFQPVYMYAHNGKGFDTYMVKTDKFVVKAQSEGKLKFKSMIKNTNGILNFQIMFKGTKINLNCTMAHISGSLKKMCKDFKVPESISKDGFDAMSVNKNNFMSDEIKQKLCFYLQNDVLSLSNIWLKHFRNILRILNPKCCEGDICVCFDDVQKIQEIKILDIRRSLSSAGMSWNSMCYLSEEIRELGVKKSIGQFDCPLMKQFVRKCIKGGRVVAMYNEWVPNIVDG